jgi:hypothetical protein
MTMQTRGAHKGLPAKPGNPRGINQYTRAENPVIVETPPQAPVVAPEEITTAREALLSRAAPPRRFLWRPSQRAHGLQRG